MSLFVKRPWGKMWKLIYFKNFWLKLIWVKERTSLQSHAKRDEWHIGINKVPAGQKHRLTKGVFIELALGEPKEEDIIRYEDDYGRTKATTVAVSGGFDPIHVGHVRMFQDAKKLGDKLVVILNNDNWLKKKKGYVFMPENERKEIIEALDSVDEVFITEHEPGPEDMSVCDALRKIRPHIFANGGDRKLNNIPEVPVCEEIGCEMIFNVGRGGKIQSSSQLVEKYKGATRNKI